MASGKNITIVKEKINQFIVQQYEKNDQINQLQIALGSIDSAEIISNDLHGELLIAELNNRM